VLFKTNYWKITKKKRRIVKQIKENCQKNYSEFEQTLGKQENCIYGFIGME